MYEITTETSFDFSSPEYAELFARSGTTAFQHPVWLDNFYRILVPASGAAPLVVTVRDAGRLLMVLPMLRRSYAFLRAVEFADLGVSDYVAPVVAATDFEAILTDAAAVATIRRILRPYDVLRIRKLRADDALTHRLFGTSLPRVMRTSTYPVRLDRPFEEWRQQVYSPSRRKDLDMKRRRLERHGEIRLEVAEDGDRLGLLFERLRHYRDQRFGTADVLQKRSFFDFYLAIATNPALGRTYALTVDGDPVAIEFGLAHEGVFCYLLPGFDQTRLRNCSIGAQLIEMIIADCLARGEHTIDFTIGDEPYKLTYGAVPSPIFTSSGSGSALGWAASAFVDQAPAVRAVAKRLLALGDAALSKPSRNEGSEEAIRPNG